MRPSLAIGLDVLKCTIIFALTSCFKMSIEVPTSTIQDVVAQEINGFHPRCEPRHSGNWSANDGRIYFPASFLLSMRVEWSLRVGNGLIVL